MPASKAEQVLDALKTLLEMVPDAVLARNSVLPEKIPDGGLIIVRDGDPGEPEQALGGFGSTYYEHAVEIEVYVEEGDAAARDAAFDDLLQQIGAALEADPTLGGFGSTYYQHAVEVEIYVEEGDATARDAAFDTLLQQIGVALEADPTLGGLAFGVTYGRPEPVIEAVAGAPAIKTATLTLTVDYESDAPLA